MNNSCSLNGFTWWKHGLIYHIYPLSFCDSDNDGYGDLKGITGKLDYLMELGIDAVWISPVFKSPFIDFGYDISDYYQIDPVFGTLDDFRELLNEAHKRHIRVIMDMVLNHTSDQHPWFIESSESRESPYGDWYIWKKPKNGGEPNNWKSVFGGSAWQFDPGRGEYYLHTFFKEQPDLNWFNDELRKTIFNVMIYWLEIGVDGFRLDAINMIIKDKKFRNNPDLFSAIFKRSEHQTRNKPESYEILRQLRSALPTDKECILIGEIYVLPPGDPLLAASYLDTLNLTFNFSTLFTRWNAGFYMNMIEKWYNSIPEGAWPCFVFSNHDMGRWNDRFGFSKHSIQKAKVKAMLLLTLKGTPFIYYGEEIGMKNKKFKKNETKDPLGKKYWPFYKGRDQARTPMQWNPGNHAGFSKVRPWLPVHPSYTVNNVELLQHKEGSLLNFYKDLIRLRKDFPSLTMGEWFPCDHRNGILSYFRIKENEKVIIFLNFTSRIRVVTTGIGFLCKALLSTSGKRQIYVNTDNLLLEPYEALLVLILEKNAI